MTVSAESIKLFIETFHVTAVNLSEEINFPNIETDLPGHLAILKQAFLDKFFSYFPADNQARKKFIENILPLLKNASAKNEQKILHLTRVNLINLKKLSTTFLLERTHLLLNMALNAAKYFPDDKKFIHVICQNLTNELKKIHNCPEILIEIVHDLAQYNSIDNDLENQVIPLLDACLEKINKQEKKYGGKQLLEEISNILTKLSILLPHFNSTKNPSKHYNVALRALMLEEEALESALCYISCAKRSPKRLDFQTISKIILVSASLFIDFDKPLQANVKPAYSLFRAAYIHLYSNSKENNDKQHYINIIRQVKKELSDAGNGFLSILPVLDEWKKTYSDTPLPHTNNHFVHEFFSLLTYGSAQNFIRKFELPHNLEKIITITSLLNETEKIFAEELIAKLGEQLKVLNAQDLQSAPEPVPSMTEEPAKKKKKHKKKKTKTESSIPQNEAEDTAHIISSEPEPFDEKIDTPASELPEQVEQDNNNPASAQQPEISTEAETLENLADEFSSIEEKHKVCYSIRGIPHQPALETNTQIKTAIINLEHVLEEIEKQFFAEWEKNAKNITKIKFEFIAKEDLVLIEKYINHIYKRCMPKKESLNANQLARYIKHYAYFYLMYTLFLFNEHTEKNKHLFTSNIQKIQDILVLLTEKDNPLLTEINQKITSIIQVEMLSRRRIAYDELYTCWKILVAHVNSPDTVLIYLNKMNSIFQLDKGIPISAQTENEVIACITSTLSYTLQNCNSNPGYRNLYTMLKQQKEIFTELAAARKLPSSPLNNSAAPTF